MSAPFLLLENCSKYRDNSLNIMATIKVMGHCPPDTDSTCSPLVYAWFLKNIKGLDAEAVICGKLNKETEFVLNELKVPAPTQIESVTEGDKLVLVDTNNPEELISGWDKAEIIEIVDHHKLFGLKTASPATITIRTYGCVATVLWELMKEAHDKTPKEIAGLLLACILSDTLKFTSPTTTETDKKVAAELAIISGIDVDTFATGMFEAKSNLDGMDAQDILSMDAKDFDFGGKIYKIAVLETTNPSSALEKKVALLAQMTTIKADNALAGMFFFIVDILKSEAVLLTTTEEELVAAEKAFSATRDESKLLFLPGIVSRKKQIAPKIEEAILS